MALFDDLSRKLSQAGQTAVQKTKEMTDITRLNGAISEEEKKINNSYFQIGKLYVALHLSDYEEDFSGMINAIKESERKISEYRQQIQDIRGVIRCEKCGAEIPNSVAFCSSCGAAIPGKKAEADENLVKCTGCGAMINKNMRFCTSCGKPMTEIAALMGEPESVIQKRVCQNCGAEAAEGNTFCMECGTKI